MRSRTNLNYDGMNISIGKFIKTKSYNRFTRSVAGNIVASYMLDVSNRHSCKSSKFQAFECYAKIVLKTLTE